MYQNQYKFKGSNEWHNSGKYEETWEAKMALKGLKKQVGTCGTVRTINVETGKKIF